MEKEKVKLSEIQHKVLKFLADDFQGEANCYYFRGIEKATGLERRLVRLACRALARKGLATYTKGLFNMDDRMVAGSGYCASLEGALYFNACIDCKNNLSSMVDGRCQDCWEKVNKKSHE